MALGFLECPCLQKKAPPGAWRLTVRAVVELYPHFFLAFSRTCPNQTPMVRVLM